MQNHIPTRNEALALLKAYNSNASLIDHALAVEAVMRHAARQHGADEDAWGIVGLIHDVDYERFPDAHCLKAREILTEQGWPEAYIRAVVAHGWGICTDIEPLTLLERTLYAVDELVGFVTACALVRPSKSVMDLKVDSVRKKWKQKGFAAGVDREVIDKGAKLLGVERDKLVADVIEGMRSVAIDIGLG